MLISPKPCEIERFRRNSRTTGCLRNVIFVIFKKNFSSIKPIFLKFGREVHWVNSLYGIAFGGNCLIDQ